MAIELPKLPYPLDALEPYISRTTLEIHHGRHHSAYVEKTNLLIADTELANRSQMCASRSMNSMARRRRRRGRRVRESAIAPTCPAIIPSQGLGRPTRGKRRTGRRAAPGTWRQEQLPEAALMHRSCK